MTKERCAARHCTRPERSRKANPDCPDMSSYWTTSPAPQKWHCMRAADMPAVAAGPIVYISTRALKRAAAGRRVIASADTCAAAPACQCVAIPMDGQYVTRRTRRFAHVSRCFAHVSRMFRNFHTGHFACFAHVSRCFAHVSRLSHWAFRMFRTCFAHVSRLSHWAFRTFRACFAALRTYFAGFTPAITHISP